MPEHPTGLWSTDQMRAGKPSLPMHHPFFSFSPWVIMVSTAIAEIKFGLGNATAHPFAG
jgi:hypothetical protein